MQRTQQILSRPKLFVPLAAAMLLSSAPVPAQESFLRGDANVDGQLSISDYLTLRRFLFGEDLPLLCPDAADFGDDGLLNFVDGIQLINYIYLAQRGGPPPAAPFPALGVDPTEDEYGCENYSVTPPEANGSVLRVGVAEGAPGETVVIPVYVTPTVEVEALQLILRYDADVFTPINIVSVDPEDFAPYLNGTVYEDLGAEEVVTLYEALDEIEEDVIVLAFIPSLGTVGFEVPVGPEVRVINIVGTISEAAEVGTEVVLQPTGDGVGVANLRTELTHRGSARYFSNVPSTVNGLLKIVGDQTFFRRGDTDGNLTFDMSDPISTLNFLFLGGSAPNCMDAADSDDSGDLNLSDAVHSLTYLFLGGAIIPPPFPNAGRDTTLDALDCSLYPTSS